MKSKLVIFLLSINISLIISINFYNSIIPEKPSEFNDPMFEKEGSINPQINSKVLDENKYLIENFNFN